MNRGASAGNGGSRCATCNRAIASTEPPQAFPLDVAFTTLSPLLGENAGCVLNALPTALDWVKRNQPLTAYQIETLSAIVTALGQISKLTSDYHDKFDEVLESVREVVA